MASMSIPSAPTPPVPPLPLELPGSLGDWQASSQDLRAGLFMQEVAAEAWLVCGSATPVRH